MSDKPSQADRQNARGLAVNAAATMAAAEFDNRTKVSMTEMQEMTELWTVRFMHFIENGRWPE